MNKKYSQTFKSVLITFFGDDEINEERIHNYFKKNPEILMNFIAELDYIIENRLMTKSELEYLIQDSFETDDDVTRELKKFRLKLTNWS